METKETVHISDLHFDHKLWINELKFVEMQMNIFEEKLGEVVAINTDAMARAKVEAFQNQIIRQKEVIDEIKHKIRLREQDISSLDNQDTVKEGGVLFNDHESEIDEMNTFIRLYEKMRDEFKSFVSEVS
jgi:hypothetical protein